MTTATTTLRTLRLTIDGQTVTVPEGTTIWDAARSVEIEIPTLCHDPKLEAVGVCRMCSVEVEGARTLVASCVREVENDMVVRTGTDRVERSRRVLTDLLISEQPDRAIASADDELFSLGLDGEHESSLPRGEGRGLDESSPAIRVDHQACILCDRCIRACGDLQNHDIIRRTGKGYSASISFDLDQGMGESNCVSCGECVAACPTSALTNAVPQLLELAKAELTEVDSVCPYCGVGCALTYRVDAKRNQIVAAEGRPSPGNDERLCVKGRYGWDYAMHSQRLTTPLIRIDYPKGALSAEVKSSERRRRKAGGIVNYEEVMPAFREATWDEALELVAEKLGAIRDRDGANALAGFGSAKCSNEEAYLFQKLVRATFGTNNVDHCTRLCHASSVAALLEMIGSGAVTTTYRDIENSDFALLTGTNTTSNHPVAATFFKNAARRGAKLLVVDPIRNEIANHAWRFCQIRPGTDVAFYNGMMNIIIAEGLLDQTFIDERTTDFETVRAATDAYTPDVTAGICGISVELLREVALEYGRARAAITFWGMGMSQHVHGTDNCRALISLCLMTGNVGRPGTGLHPLRGQNNVQGASDAGLVPMFFPGYRSVEDAEARATFSEAWDCELDPVPGLTVTEIIGQAVEGKIKGMYMLGENPFGSDPNVNKVRGALSKLEFLVVQDIFLTETAEFADVILPASSALEKEGTFTNTDRRVQIGRHALKPPGEARLDWQIICDISTRMGNPMKYESPSDIFDEFVSLTPSYGGLTYDGLGATGKLYPCPNPSESDGTVVMFGDSFPTENGRARFVTADHTGADELPDTEYPFILVTGRVLEHWHTGVMTRRSRTLHAIEPEAFAKMHVDDCAKLGLEEGDAIRVASRRGAITLQVRVSDSVQPGSVFIPFHFREASANILTTDKVDPDGKIPEFKFCAVQIEPATFDDDPAGPASGPAGPSGNRPRS